MKVSEWIEKLQKIENKEKHICMELWQMEDLYGMGGAEKLTPGDFNNILDSVERNHNAEIGINWDVLSCAVEQYVSEYKEGE